MLKVDIPGFRKLTLQHLVFDFNGTLAVDGKLIDGVKSHLIELSKTFTLHVITADTFGQAASELKGLPLNLKIITGSSQAEVKQRFVDDLGAEKVMAFGNGRNDRLMLQKASVGVVVLQQEGASGASLQSADVVCQNILDALQLVVNPKRLIATLRD